MIIESIIQNFFCKKKIRRKGFKSIWYLHLIKMLKGINSYLKKKENNDFEHEALMQLDYWYESRQRNYRQRNYSEIL